MVQHVIPHLSGHTLFSVWPYRYNNVLHGRGSSHTRLMLSICTIVCKIVPMQYTYSQLLAKASIANVKRFAGLNICDFSLMKFSRKYFHGASTISVNHLPIVKYSQKNSCGTLKNREYHKSLAQRMFSRFQYSIKSKQTRCIKNFEFEKGSRDRNKK